MLNKALRIQNIDLIFLLRFFIRDIHHQLEMNQYPLSIRVYRGQLMSTEELKILQKSIGELISINSFLSTSQDRHLALFYLGTDEGLDDGVQQVLFEIDLNPQFVDRLPFANITSQSYFPDEQEFLIMLGSIFRLVSISHEEDRLWIVQMTLCTNHDHAFQSIFDHMRNEYGTGETNVGSISNVLRDMAQYDKAEKYLHRLLREISDDSQMVSECFSALGLIHTNIANAYRDLALENANVSLDIYKKSLLPEHPQIAWTFDFIGQIYENMGHLQPALVFFEKAAAIFRRVLPSTHYYLDNSQQHIQRVRSQLK